MGGGIYHVFFSITCILVQEFSALIDGHGVLAFGLRLLDTREACRFLSSLAALIQHIHDYSTYSRITFRSTHHLTFFLHCTYINLPIGKPATANAGLFLACACKSYRRCASVAMRPGPAGPGACGSGCCRFLIYPYTRISARADHHTVYAMRPAAQSPSEELLRCSTKSLKCPEERYLNKPHLRILDIPGKTIAVSGDLPGRPKRHDSLLVMIVGQHAAEK